MRKLFAKRAEEVKSDNKNLSDKLRMMTEGEHITLYVYRPNYTRRVNVYVDKLTPAEKEELESIKTRLLDMAVDASEDVTTVIKKNAR